MPSAEAIGEALQALVDGVASEDQVTLVRELAASGAIVRLTGERAAEVGGNVTDSIFTTGDGNRR